MACNHEHEGLTTAYCSDCGTRLSYDRPADLLRHLKACEDTAGKAVANDPTERRKRDMAKWSAWTTWVRTQMANELSRAETA